MQVGLPPAQLWTVDDVFGGWAAAQSRFFDAGQILDRIQEELGRRRVEQRQVAQAKKAT
jgi:ABC-type sulfate transport system substrate-binding protein